MFESRPLPNFARALVCLVALGVTLVAAAAAAQAPAVPDPAQRPRLRSQPPPPTGEAAAVRLMVFSLQRQSAFDALSAIRPLLSVQGSVEVDPNRNTISVRDNLAALSRVAIAIRVFDRENQPVKIDVQLILAETAKISPVRPDVGLAPDLLGRLRQLLRFQTFSLLARSQIASREGESVVFEMAQGYRLSFEVGSIAEGKQIRLAGFRMVRAQPGAPEKELVRTVVHLGLDQPLILGMTRDEAADRALMLVLRYENSPTATAGN